jgi:hypothetical protein
MTHRLGRVVHDGRTVSQSSGIDLTPLAGPNGPVRFVILHFDNVNLAAGAQLTVQLGYGIDVFTADSGASFWSRPADTALLPIQIHISGGTGSARLLEFGSGEPDIPPGQSPGTPVGSLTNPDVFLHTSPYQEPTYETRLECNPGFAWRNAACSLAPIPDSVRERVKAATGIIVEVDGDHVSSCSGTLIGADLFLTARHCLTDPGHADLLSSSVTFDYATACDGSRPAGHVTRFFKVIEEVAWGSPPTGSNPPSSTDWVVVRLDASPGALPAPLTLRAAAPMAGETIFTMHHPNGAAKKTQAGTFGGGAVTGFDYAGGSSGSALFDMSGQLVGGPLSQGSGCSVTYAPAAAIKAALSNPPAPPAPIDVMVVFDHSGSMASSAPPAGRSKLAEAQDAAALFVQLVREGQGDRIGLVGFSTNADIVAAPAPAATAKPALVGPAPFTGGQIGSLGAGGATSIGAGVGTALLSLGSTAHQRAILLLTDGLQNTLPMLEEVEGSLGNTIVNVIGFGSDADLDGALLSRVAHAHGGHFTRATDGLALRKFFGLSFGNIFESGALSDPEYVLKASEQQSAPHYFNVCGEERITLALTWDAVTTPLRAAIYTPSGKLISERTIHPVRGRSWVFWRIGLPHDGERDGRWYFIVDRVPTGGEFPPPPTDVRYQYLVICAGGPRLVPLPAKRRYYTGDVFDPLVAFHYPNRSFASGASVVLHIERPEIALGQLTTNSGLRAPVTTVDAVDAFHATLQQIAQGHGGTLPVPVTRLTMPLFDDGLHDDGAMEPDGIYNNRMKDLLRTEGTYQFRAVATFGEGCTATREAHWSIHVEPAIDPGRTIVVVTGVHDVSGHRQGTLVVTPYDPYGNPIGPGRGGLFTVTPLPGVDVTVPLHDRGDGSYEVGVNWDPAVTQQPGVIVQQAERPPIVVAPPPGGNGSHRPPRDCRGAADKLIECLGLCDVEVESVRVTKVNLEVTMQAPECRQSGRKDGERPPEPPPKGCGC